MLQQKLPSDSIPTANQTFIIKSFPHAKQEAPFWAGLLLFILFIPLLELANVLGKSAFHLAACSAIQSLPLCLLASLHGKQTAPTLLSCLSVTLNHFPTRSSSNLKGMSLLLYGNCNVECFQSSLPPFMLSVLCLAELDGSIQS